MTKKTLVDTKKTLVDYVYFRDTDQTEEIRGFSARDTSHPNLICWIWESDREIWYPIDRIKEIVCDVE